MLHILCTANVLYPLFVVPTPLVWSFTIGFKCSANLKRIVTSCLVYNGIVGLANKIGLGKWRGPEIDVIQLFKFSFLERQNVNRRVHIFSCVVCSEETKKNVHIPGFAGLIK